MPGETIEVTVNGERQRVGSATLDILLTELGFGEAKVATALNGDFVPAGRRGDTRVAAGDRIEVVTPRQGG